MKRSQKQTIIEWFQQRLSNIELIYLFGSAVFDPVTSSAERHSDIDLAILTDQTLDPVQCWNLQQQLACELNQDIDLVDLMQASTVLQQQIIGHGECLYSNKDADLHLSLKVMSQYQRLNDERKGIVQDFMGVKENE